MKLHLDKLSLRQGAFRLEIDLEIEGQVIGIFGPSGAGKTTLLETIAGLRRPETGAIRVGDTVPTDVAAGTFLAPEHRGIGYVPQDLALFPHLSVRQNLLYGQRKHGALPGVDLGHVTAVLEIESLLSRSVPTLSGGQKQRVAFARALLSSPQLLVMDEPLANLDHGLKLRIIPYLQRIRDEFKIPTLYVSHSPDEVVALCDRVIVLREGRCVRTSAPLEIFETTTTHTVKPGILD